MTPEQKALREAVATICGGNYIAADAAISVALERAAKVIDGNGILNTVDGQVLAKRMDGDRSGLAYAAAIRALIPAP